MDYDDRRGQDFGQIDLSLHDLELHTRHASIRSAVAEVSNTVGLAQRQRWLERNRIRPLT